MTNNDSGNALKTAPLHLAAGLLAAAATALPCFFSRSETVQLVVSGFAAKADLALASWSTGAMALLYRLGGWWLADTGRALLAGFPVFLAFAVAAFLLSRLPAKFCRLAGWLIPMSAGVLVVLGVMNAISASRTDVRDLRLILPVRLLDQVSGIEGRVFFNANAVFPAALFAPEKLVDGSDLASIKKLEHSPVEWRAEDRREGFRAAVLTGSLAESRPLLESLSASPGWGIAMIDNHGLLFQRGAASRTSSEPSPEEAKRLFSKPQDQALYLAQSALVYQAIGRGVQSRSLMGQALQLAPDAPLVLVKTATLAANEGRWSDVRELAEKILKDDPASVQARYFLARSLLETGSIDMAAAQSKILLSQRPSDPGVLWLCARVSRESNDPAAEIETLQVLMRLAKNQKESPHMLHIYLGQAWAKQGFPAQALENYEAALKGDLSPEQRRHIEESIRLIELRTNPGG
jgi:tetratricopeptide (TPR) repeat protein